MGYFKPILLALSVVAAQAAVHHAHHLRMLNKAPTGMFGMTNNKVLDLGGGLTLTITKPGDGKTFPQVGDELTMHYTGTLAKDGTKFDSSRDRKEPFKFPIGTGRVIKGWDEGVIKMSVGERGVLHVPADKGYGARGAGDVIPPNADLDFDVQLLAINGTPEAPEQGFEGEDVSHEDGVTHTDDWRREYGPKSGQVKEKKPEKVQKSAAGHLAIGFVTMSVSALFL